MPYLNYAHPGQEGRHRMWVAGELFGWDKKFPCLVVTWADEERHKREVEEKRRRDIQEWISKAIQKTKQFRYENMDEVAEELEWQFEKEEGFIKNNDIVYKIETDPHTVRIKITDGYEVGYDDQIDIEDVKIEPREEDDISDDILLDMDDKDLEDILREMGL